MVCMKISRLFSIAILSFAVFMIGAYTVDKLEARLQADPECKPIMNAKTGALMPCPGSDKQFYKSIPALNTTAPKVNQGTEIQTSKATTSPSSTSISRPTTAPKAATAPVECKPQLHQKSGSLMPCPAP